MSHGPTSRSLHRLYFSLEFFPDIISWCSKTLLKRKSSLATYCKQCPLSCQICPASTIVFCSLLHCPSAPTVWISVFVSAYLRPFKMRFLGDWTWACFILCSRLEEEPGIVQELGRHFERWFNSLCSQAVSVLAQPACLPEGMVGKTAQVLPLTVK